MGEPRNRDHLERSLYDNPMALRKYRASIARVSLGIFWSGFVSILVGVLFRVPLVTTVGTVWLASTLIAAPVSWWLDKFGSRRRLDVSREKFILDHGDGRAEEFRLADVEHIRLLWVPFFSGSIRLHMKDGRSLTLQRNWERFDYVLDLLRSVHPEMTSFARYDKFRASCIALDHWRSRMLEFGAHPRRYLPVVFKIAFMTPLVSSLFVWALKAFSLGHGIFPSNGRVFFDAMFASVLIWSFWYAFEDWVIYRDRVRALMRDPLAVRRDRLAESKFVLSYGTGSWLAFAVGVAFACVGCALGIN